MLKLTSTRPSHERVVYAKLLKYRDEHLENYQGPIMEYSQSDHHHVPISQPPPVPKLPVRSSTRASLTAPRHASNRMSKSTSQYTLLHEDPIRKRQKTRHPSVADTEHSYDPFRSSRQPIDLPADHARVTVLRPGSSGSQQKKDGKRIPSRVSLRYPAIERIDEVGDYSVISSPPVQSRISSRTSQPGRISHGVSRLSMTSTSSTGRKVSSVSSKRHVSFPRNRRILTGQHPASKPPTEPLPSPPPLTLNQRFVSDGYKMPHTLPTSQTVTAASASSAQIVRSRKPMPRAQMNRNSAYWKEESQRLSSELSKVCDEAFNRDSAISSTIATTTTSQPDRHSKSTETSISLHETATNQINERNPILDRPLPPPPAEYLGNYAQRELAKARELLKQRAADPSLGAPGCLDDVIAHLDRLMQPSTARIYEEERRAASAPQQRLSGVGLEPRKDTFERFLENGYTGLRAISEPMKDTPRKTGLKRDTIRLVEADEASTKISPTKPLTIHKRSNGSAPSDGTVRGKKTMAEPDQLRDNHRSYAEWRSAGMEVSNDSLSQIGEENKENAGISAPKKRTWFGRGGNTTKPLATKGQTRTALGELAVEHVANCDKRASNGSSEEFPPRKGRGRFFKIFAKPEKRELHRPPYAGTLGKFIYHVIPLPPIDCSSAVASYDLANAQSQTTATTSTCPERETSAFMSGALAPAESTSSTSTMRPNRSLIQDNEVPAPAVIKPHSNWFARFLRIKPASYALCLQISRVQARKEIVSILRGWKKYGLKDLVVDKTRCIIAGRVDGKNGM